MAKSLFMQGQAAGFDMSDEAQMNAFFLAYIARPAADGGGSAGAPRGVPGRPDEDPRVRRNQARRLRKRIAGKRRR